ncbi:MAG: hypothetical protein AAF985_14700, partial [Bacteroidota bacterium]
MKDNDFANDGDSIDELFAKKFDYSTVPPKQQDRDSIQEQLDQEHLDQFVKQQFEQFERRPSEKVWQQVATQLPLNLRLKNQLQWLSKIAAILVLGMFVAYLFDRNPRHSKLAVIQTYPEYKQENETTKIATVATADAKEAFVFDIPAAKTSKKYKHNQETPEEKELQEADDFLASILLDEGEFGDQINELKIAQILQPIEPLPIENLVALTTVPFQETEGKEKSKAAQPLAKAKVSPSTAAEEIELQIKIPL